MEQIGSTIGEYVRQAFQFIIDGNNTPIVIGIFIIFGIIVFLLNGTKRIMDSLFFLVVSFYIIARLCAEFDINIDFVGILNQFVQFISSIFSTSPGV